MRYEYVDGKEVAIDDDFTTDKDGKPVDDDVTAMLESLDTAPNRQKVLCHYHETGRIGFWSCSNYISNHVFERVNEMDGWEVDFAKTREASGHGKQGYCEIARSDY